MYYIYVLRCSDNSLYTGITNDFKKRYETHFSKNSKAAKYTRSRQVVGVTAVWETENKSHALKLEIRIKKLSKDKKEFLVKNPTKIHDFLDVSAQIYQYADANKLLK